MDRNASVAFVRENSDFLSRGTRCAGWLYLPRNVPRPPIVIMAHGLALEKAFRLSAFAERFAQNSLAAFVFDYRNFGDSDGEPRNLVSPRRHLQDWKSAIAHVRSLPGIDHERIALWGTSFAGGHVLVTAAKEAGISAVIAQVPYVDGLDFARAQGLKYVAQAVGAGLLDVVRMVIFGKRWKVPVVGDPGAFAVLNTPDSKPAYLTMVPQGSQWHHPARGRLEVPVGLLDFKTVSREEPWSCDFLDGSPYFPVFSMIYVFESSFFCLNSVKQA